MFWVGHVLRCSSQYNGVIMHFPAQRCEAPSPSACGSLRVFKHGQRGYRRSLDGHSIQGSAPPKPSHLTVLPTNERGVIRAYGAQQIEIALPHALDGGCGRQHNPIPPSAQKLSWKHEVACVGAASFKAINVHPVGSASLCDRHLKMRSITISIPQPNAILVQVSNHTADAKARYVENTPEHSPWMRALL
jgi:hypothetical protein